MRHLYIPKYRFSHMAEKGGIRPDVYILGFVSFLTDISSEMIFPLLPLFLTNILGASTAIVGLVEGVADSIASLTDILFGYWSDRLGKRKIFAVAGYGLSSVLKLGFALASSWPLVLVLRGIERLGKSIRTSPRDALIAASSDEKSRGRAFGIHRTMDTFGAIAGPALAYLILSIMGTGEAGYRAVFLYAIIPAAIGTIALWLFVREPKAPAPAVQKERLGFFESLKKLDSKYKKFLGISCIFSLSYFSFALFIVRAGQIGISTENILLAYLIYNIAYALASFPAGAIADKIGGKPVISSAFVLYGLICIGFIFVSEFWQVAALFFIYGIFVAIDDSVNKAYISKLAGESVRGTALGAYNTAVGAVYLPANIAFGALWAAFGPAAAFGAAAGVAIIAGLLMLLERL
jgi:MFS family permease